MFLTAFSDELAKLAQDEGGWGYEPGAAGPAQPSWRQRTLQKAKQMKPSAPAPAPVKPKVEIDVGRAVIEKPKRRRKPRPVKSVKSVKPKKLGLIDPYSKKTLSSMEAAKPEPKPFTNPASSRSTFDRYQRPRYGPPGRPR